MERHPVNVLLWTEKNLIVKAEEWLGLLADTPLSPEVLKPIDPRYRESQNTTIQGKSKNTSVDISPKL